MNKERLDVPKFSDNQSMKDCKKSTPCDKILKNDTVFVSETKSLVDGSIIKEGYYKFDSYDKYDNTVYIICNHMTKNILYSDIRELTKDEEKDFKIKVNE